MTKYPLPGQGGHSLGWTLEGFEFMPLYTGTNGEGAYEKCELSSCADHVPEAGGGIHFHADPFGPNCLYDSTDYVNSDGT